MKTITTEINLYEFEELSPTGQDLAASKKIEYLFADDFVDYIHECEFYQYFDPKNGDEMEVQFSLSCCQGDGLEIYGTARIFALYEAARDHLKNKNELPSASEILPDCVYWDMYTHEPNRNYCYSTWDFNAQSIGEELIYIYEGWNDEEEAPDEIQKNLYEAGEIIADGMQAWCKQLEREGYEQLDYYYTPEAHENELFTENGKFYGYAWDI